MHDSYTNLNSNSSKLNVVKLILALQAKRLVLGKYFTHFMVKKNTRWLNFSR